MCDHCGCREYPPIGQLAAEHVEILAMAEALAEATRRHGTVDEAERDRLVALLRHHGDKEESGLYPLLINQMGSGDGEYAHLEAEHREVLEVIAAGRFDHLALYALQRHIEEEEEELFPMSSFWFDGDTWEDLEAIHDHAVASDAGVLRTRAGSDQRTSPRS